MRRARRRPRPRSRARTSARSSSSAGLPSRLRRSASESPPSGIVDQEREGAALERELRGVAAAESSARPCSGGHGQWSDEHAPGAATGGPRSTPPSRCDGSGLRRLEHEDVAVRHGDERQLLAHLLLAVLRLAVRRHVGHLAGEAAGARLAAGVRVDLRVEHDHAHRLARRQQARQVLEADVEHGAVAARRRRSAGRAGTPRP